MPLIWCAISSHGLGHAAQLVPVLNELGRSVPNLRAILRTLVPAWFFEGRLAVPWTRSEAQQDVGCVQHGPLAIDVPATWEAHARFHADWDRRVRDEASAIRAATPALVLSDISHLAIASAARAGVPSVGLCNLSWDHVLEPLAAPADPDHHRIVEQIRRAYANAALLLRPAPGIPMKAFGNIVDIGPIVDPILVPRGDLGKALAAGPAERIVLIGFGGIELDALPFEELDRLEGARFIVTGSVPERCVRIRAASTLPYSFRTLLASSDILVTKPGYSTVVEAVALGKPVVYVRRYNFADEQSLVDYLHRHGRAVELSAEDFSGGRWENALQTVQATPPPSAIPPSSTGAVEAARLLSRFF